MDTKVMALVAICVILATLLVVALIIPRETKDIETPAPPPTGAVVAPSEPEPASVSPFANSLDTLCRMSEVSFRDSSMMDLVYLLDITTNHQAGLCEFKVMPIDEDIRSMCSTLTFTIDRDINMRCVPGEESMCELFCEYLNERMDGI
jgi:hypothetical protein